MLFRSVEGVGTGIALVPVGQLVVPETFGSELASRADYITINRSSQDQNAWSRSNRWFHKDVILAAASYNSTAANYGPDIPGRRPIIEFDAGLQLFNHGIQAKNNVDYIVLSATDAFVDIEGQQTATIDGNTLKTGDRVIFTNDYDSTIINEVWEVVVQVINSTNYITLNATTDDPVITGQNVLITSGAHAGKTYYYNGTGWSSSQTKSGLNQAPLFDLVDANGYSFTNTTVYPGSTFAGSQLFGYKSGTGTNDALLGFPLSYQTFNNIGDIAFTNYYDTDTFTYTVNQTQTTVDCNSGYMVVNSGLSNAVKQNNWVTTAEDTEQFQVFTTFYEGLTVPGSALSQPTVNPIPPIATQSFSGNFPFVQIDVLPTAQTTIPHVKVYVDNQIQTPGKDYFIATYGIYYLVALTATPELGTKIDVEIFADSISPTAYYEVPKNLDFNPLNENFTQITLVRLEPTTIN